MNRRIATDLGKRIRQAREGRGLTQAQLAKLTRKSIETISNFERGKTVPSVQTLYSLAEHLDLAVAQFFAVDVKTQTEPRIGPGIAAKLAHLSKDDNELVSGFVDLLIRNRKASRS